MRDDGRLIAMHFEALLMPHFIYPDLIYGRVEFELYLSEVSVSVASSVFCGPFSDVRVRRVLFRFFLGESKKPEQRNSRKC